MSPLGSVMRIRTIVEATTAQFVRWLSHGNFPPTSSSMSLTTPKVGGSFISAVPNLPPLSLPLLLSRKKNLPLVQNAYVNVYVPILFMVI